MNLSKFQKRLVQSGLRFSAGSSPFLAMMLLPSAAQACSVCMGDPNSNEAGAINAAIFLLLGCIAGVLGLLTAFGIYLYRRASLPLPPDMELADTIGAQST